MNRRQSKVAERLCEMATENELGITYYPLGNLPIQKAGYRTYYPVRAIIQNAGIVTDSWDYYLAADYGSFQGIYGDQLIG